MERKFIISVTYLFYYFLWLFCKWAWSCWSNNS